MLGVVPLVDCPFIRTDAPAGVEATVKLAAVEGESACVLSPCGVAVVVCPAETITEKVIVLNPLAVIWSGYVPAGIFRIL